jgi:hypothetical protein
MIVLPIVARELRVASRRRMTYWLRTGAALAVIIIGTWMFLMLQRESPAETSKALFGVMTGSALLYALLCGVRDTADCLSSEKREGTLGLLFLTDLKGYDVVLGKLFANSLNAFYGVFAVLPMLAVPLLMGGVTLGEFGRTTLVVVNSLFFSLTLGLWMSSVSRSGRKAATGTFLTLIFFCGVLPGIGAWYEYIKGANRIERALLFPSPVVNYIWAWDYWYKTALNDFWISLGVIHGFGWLFLLLATVVAPRSWQDRPAGIQKLRWRERWLMWSHGNMAERLAFRKRLLDRNAFYWLAARARLKPALVWFTLGLLGCGWVYGFSKFHRDWVSPLVSVPTAVVLNLMLKAWFAGEAGRQLAEDRKRGALELLLSTPITVRDILQGQLLALRRQFLGPLILVLVVACIFMYQSMSDTASDDDRFGTRLFWLGGMTTLVADLIALYWVGMWQGLTAKNPNRASSANVARILVLPGAVWALAILVGVLSSMRGGQEITINFMLGAWFVLGLAADLVFSLSARHKLLTRFRSAASYRYVPRKGASHQAEAA